MLLSVDKYAYCSWISWVGFYFVWFEQALVYRGRIGIAARLRSSTCRNHNRRYRTGIVTICPKCIVPERNFLLPAVEYVWVLSWVPWSMLVRYTQRIGGLRLYNFYEFASFVCLFLATDAKNATGLEAWVSNNLNSARIDIDFFEITALWSL